MRVSGFQTLLSPWPVLSRPEPAECQEAEGWVGSYLCPGLSMPSSTALLSAQGRVGTGRGPKGMERSRETELMARNEGRGFLWRLSGKESACQSRRCGFDPWVRKIRWRRKWQPTPVVLLGESHGWRSLVGYSPWSHKESDATEQQSMQACETLKRRYLGE